MCCSVALLTCCNTVGTIEQVAVVDVDNPKAPIAETMYGLFFEDINFGADGGLYAELVKNRSFEFDTPLMGWEIEGYNRNSFNLFVLNREKTNPNNPRYIRAIVGEDGCKPLVNNGFRGMGIKEGNGYRFSVLAAVPEGDVTLKVELIDEQGNVLGASSVKPSGSEWQKYQTEFKSSATNTNASLRVSFEGEGIVELDMISLFPTDTWKGRENGLRADIVQLLADMQPGFLRFPGGCIVEGRTLAQRYQWKTTVGPIEDRKLIINRWNTEFAHKFTPDYFQSFGLGFYEYFLLSEDIGAEPLPILNCGMACQYNTGELVPLEEIGPYVQDALDLIEFANGSTDTEWGALRASMGHPEPFNLKYLGIGNEQWGPQFFERYAFFEKAIMEKHPEIIIVSTAGPSVDTDLFYYAQEQLPKYNAPIVDEHFYRSPEWFFENAARYDSYDRDGYIVFAGEYAAQSVGQGNPNNKNNWLTALSEAAFMTGLERNADIVQLSSYAPMLANADAWQWTPDLIWFNNMETYGTPNYYVQKLYATNRGTEVLDMSLAGAPLTGQHGIFATAAYDEPSGEIIIKIVNRNAEDMEFSMELKSEHDVADTARKIVLASDDLEAMNSFENPTNIAPVESEINTDGKNVTLTLDGQSMTILRIKRN